MDRSLHTGILNLAEAFAAASRDGELYCAVTAQCERAGNRGAMPRSPEEGSWTVSSLPPSVLRAQRDGRVLGTVPMVRYDIRLTGQRDRSAFNDRRRAFEALAISAWELFPQHVRQHFGVRFFVEPAGFGSSDTRWIGVMLALAWRLPSTPGVLASRRVPTVGGYMDVECLMRKHQHKPTLEPPDGSVREEKSPLLRPPYDRRFFDQPVVPPEEFVADLQPGVFLASAHTLRWIATNLMVVRTGDAGPELRPITKSEVRAQCGMCFAKDVVTIWYLGESGQFQSRKGFVDLARLVTSDHPLDVSDLALLPPTVGDASRTPLMDKAAVAAVQQRLRELMEALEVERGAYSNDELEAFDGERKKIERELMLAHGRGGRERSFGDNTTPAERARRAITKRMDEAISALRESMPQLGQHLRRSIKREGTTITYDPAPPRPIWCVENAPSPRG